MSRKTERPSLVQILAIAVVIVLVLAVFSLAGASVLVNDSPPYSSSPTQGEPR